jgi:carboxylesterase type B
MDQQAALRWVQRNIASFGGNPHNTTIFGESAGGLSTLSQVASPQARGLFEKAIAEGGAYNLTQASLSNAEAAGEEFAANAGCASQTAACLRSLPVSTILASENTAGYTPNINSAVLPETLKTAFATGNFNHVPITNGPPVSFPYGAAHASEIQYVMGLPTAAFPGTLSVEQQELATIMKGYWTHLAKRGSPSSFGTPFWPPFNDLTQKMESLAPPTPQTETDFADTHNCAFWTALEAA